MIPTAPMMIWIGRQRSAEIASGKPAATLNVFPALKEWRSSCRRTRQHGKPSKDQVLNARQDMPVIVFTAYREAVSAVRVREAGIKAFVMKLVIAIFRFEWYKSEMTIETDPHRGR